MTDTFRALCEELLADYGQCRYRSELHDRACAALAEQPVAPTDEELVNFRNRATADCCASRSNNGANLLSSDDLVACQAAGLRAVLARWGQPAATPIPVAERLPGRGELRWWFEPDEDDGYGGQWSLLRLYGLYGFADPYTHWLPANALPVPTND